MFLWQRKRDAFPMKMSIGKLYPCKQRTAVALLAHPIHIYAVNMKLCSDIVSL